MLDLLLIYSISMGLVLLYVNHNRLIVSGQGQRSWAMRTFTLWFRLTVLAIVLVGGLRAYGPIPPSYGEWWDWYFTEHSLGAWIAFSLFPTVTLFLLKWVTYTTTANPSVYKTHDGSGMPDVFQVRMGTPVFWYLVYWGWLLFSPWMPFYKCFIRIYLCGANPSDVFPAA